MSAGRSSTHRSIFVGDIHACLQEFDKLLAKVNYVQGEDDLVLVGDLVAKGPDSVGVVRRARELGARGVLGNHDFQVLYCGIKAGLLNEESLSFDANGEGLGVDPDLTPEHMEIAQNMRPDDWSFLTSLPLYLRIPQHNVIVVHAGLMPGVPLAGQSPRTLMKIRNIADGVAQELTHTGVPWTSLWKGPETIIYGHDAVRGLQCSSEDTPYSIGLDSGCCYGKELSAYIFPGREIAQVSAEKVYVEPKIQPWALPPEEQSVDSSKSASS